MLRNYLKIALRSFSKQKSYTFINVFGLALGIACCLLILMLVQHEFSYDDFHENADRIFRVVIQETNAGGEKSHRLLINPPVAPAMDSAFAGIEASTRLIGGTLHVQHGDESFAERVYMVDSTFFRIFSFPLLAGRSASALDEVQDVVISERTARKYFGVSASDYDRVVGEQIAIKQGSDAFEFIISGVAADPPTTSSLQFDVLIPFDNYNYEGTGRLYLGGNDWGGRNAQYVLLTENQQAEALQAALPPFTKIAFSDRIASRRNAEYIAEGDDAFRLVLQPLFDLHLNPEIGAYYEETPHNPTYSYVLLGIGFLVLLIACINFVTLSLGRSTSRAREVGMRKVLGARRTQLMQQFWGEALLLTLVGLGVGLVLVKLILPDFNALTGKQLTMIGSTGWAAVLGFAALIGLIAMIAGAYPAAVLSAFRPAVVLKGDISARKSTFSRILVVVQYCISVGLIFSTIVMVRQLHHLLNRDLGFDDDQILVMDTGWLNTQQQQHILQAVRIGTASEPNVLHVLKTGYAFTYGHDRQSWEDAQGQAMEAHMLGVDYDFLGVLGMDLIAGRDFSRAFPSDCTQSVLVNEAFVREYDIADPLGYRLTGFGAYFGDITPTIIGVVKDFNFRSLHETVEPAVLNMHPDYYQGMSHMLIKVRPNDLAGTIDRLRQIWSESFPDKPFHYSFLNEHIEAQYATERRWSVILTHSSLVAILIACMGLFGLATLSVARRTKEIGIRKVLGSSVLGVVLLIGREFAVLVVFAIVIAWPLAYFSMREWLEGFAYRIGIAWWIFVAAGLAAFFIAMATVSFQSIRAATLNPVHSLRYE